MSQHGHTIDEHLDLAGEVCPYTLVRSKLALEQLNSGQILQVSVDNSESASNVPRSLELEGHQVIQVEKEPSGWAIVVRKA
jgi:tRNA 2-thiouridine synthesizing protein A